jgi:hypothetical protein
MNVFNSPTPFTPKTSKPKLSFDPLLGHPRGALEYLDEERILLHENNFLKLSILASELKIPPGESKWYYLALKLAGMIYKQPARRGAKKKRTKENDELLIATVKQLIKQKPSFSVLQICKSLVRDPQWREKISPESKDPAEALRKRYYDAKKKKSVK